MKPIDPAAYRTAAAFRTALDDRLRARETEAVPFARQRQLFVFERFSRGLRVTSVRL